MSASMAEGIAAHQMLSGGGWFACSNPECGWKLKNTLSPREFHATAWPVREFSNHVAEVLAAAGYGDVRQARAQALEDAAAELARLPYVSPFGEGRAEYESMLAVRRGNTDGWLLSKAAEERKP